MSDNQKSKISKSHIGIKHTEESKKKMSQYRIGKPSKNKGKKRPVEFGEKVRLWMTGRKVSLETRKKRSETLKRIGHKPVAMSGEKHYKWKGGIRKYGKTHYMDKRYKDWRTSVFERDNWTCQTCGERGYVEPHHIKGYTEFPEYRFDIDNGVTLCKECHKDVTFKRK